MSTGVKLMAGDRPYFNAYARSAVLRDPLRPINNRPAGYQPAAHCGKPQAVKGRRKGRFGLQVVNLPHKPAGLETRCRRGRPPHIDRSTRIVAAHDARARDIFILRCGTKDYVLFVPQSRQRINSGRSPCRRKPGENRGA
jgi:hypothetical protein